MEIITMILKFILELHSKEIKSFFSAAFKKLKKNRLFLSGFNQNKK